MIVSNCCCAPDRNAGEITYSEMETCPQCKERCSFIDEDDFEPLFDDASLDLPKEIEQ